LTGSFVPLHASIDVTGACNIASPIAFGVSQPEHAASGRTAR
jgi:hypothetical protein